MKFVPAATARPEPEPKIETVVTPLNAPAVQPSLNDLVQAVKELGERIVPLEIGPQDLTPIVAAIGELNKSVQALVNKPTPTMPDRRYEFQMIKTENGYSVVVDARG